MDISRPSNDSDDPSVEVVPCGFLSLSPAGVVQQANEAFTGLSGYDRTELVGQRHLVDLLTVGGRIFYETHITPILLASGCVTSLALDLRARDGRRVPILVNAVLDRDSTGAPAGVRLALFDVTERRAFEAELVQARARAEESEARARLLVRALQHTLIPPAVPVIDGVDVAATYRPAGHGEEVGGDFYDVFELDTDDWIVVIGDVTGKGVQAAMITALARNTIRAAAVRERDPKRILETLNDVLRREETDRLCTVAIVRLSRRGDEWEASVCHGGHPLCLLVRRDEPVVELGEVGTLLGALAHTSLELVTTRLRPGDAFVLYTDGVTDGRVKGEFFGERRTIDSIHRHRGSAHGLVYGLLDDALQFQTNVAVDDIVIVAVHIPVSTPTRPGLSRRDAPRTRSSDPRDP